MNADLAPDIVTLSADDDAKAVLQVFWADPAGSGPAPFVPGSPVVTELSGLSSVLAVGDVDGDGGPDIVLTTEHGDSGEGQVFLDDLSCHFRSAQAGDANADGSLDVSDPVAILSYLFLGGTLRCPGASEVQGDGLLDVSDPIFLLSFLFLGGLPPAAPAVRDCR